eukprot:2498_1
MRALDDTNEYQQLLPPKKKAQHNIHICSSIASYSYDLFTIIVSLLDVITDVMVMIGFYNQNRMVFFWSALIILIIAQLSYIIAFWMFHGKKDDFVMGICLLCFAIPCAPCLSFLFYFAADESLYINKYILKSDLCCCLDLNDVSINRSASPLQQWMREKVHKHFGFIMEALFEAFPQSILQLIAIVYYNDTYNSFTGYVSIVSILLSMLSVTTKSFILSVATSINWKSALFNWLCFITDFFGIFFVVSIAFYVPSNDYNIDTKSFQVIQLVWISKIIIFISPFAVIGSVALNVVASYDLAMQRRWGGFCVDVILTIIIQFAWIVGLCLTIMSMEIVCFIWLIAVMSNIGLKSRVETSSAASEKFYVGLIDWIKNTHNIDNTISNTKLRMVKLCVINKVLLKNMSNKTKVNYSSYRSSDNKLENYIDERMQNNDFDCIKWKDFRINSSDENFSSFYGRFLTWYCSVYASNMDTGCWGYAIAAMTYLLFPIYLVSRIITVLFPLFIVIYLYIGYDIILWYGNIDIFQFIMFVVYVGFILILGILFVFGGVFREEFYGWHILPSERQLLIEKDIDKRSRDIIESYDEIINVPIIRKLVQNKFGMDIGDIIMHYYLLIARDNPQKA